MSPKVKRVLIAMSVIDVVAWVLTIHANLTYHHAPGKPLVMSIGQLLGWIVSGALFLLILVILKESRR